MSEIGKNGFGEMNDSELWANEEVRYSNEPPTGRKPVNYTAGLI